MICEKGMKLIEDASRNFITLMNKPLIDEVIKEVNESDKKIVEILENKNHDRDAVISDPYTHHIYLLEQHKLNRNKRCVLAYLNDRINKIQNLVWELGLPFPDHLSKNLDDKEKKYAEEYNSLLVKYSKSYCFSDLEVNKDFHPPTDLFVEVLANEDIGTIKTKYGDVKLEKNMTYYLRRSDLDHLLRKGLLTIND